LIRWNRITIAVIRRNIYKIEQEEIYTQIKNGLDTDLKIAEEYQIKI